MKIFNSCLDAIRWFFASFFSLFLIILVILGSIVLSASLTITNREGTKKILKEGEVYDNLVNIIVEEQFKKMDEGVQNGNQPTVDMSQFISKEDLRVKVNHVIPPSLLEKNGTLLIDSGYDWLEGKTEKPTFLIDLSDVQKETKLVVQEIMVRKAETLSECKTGKIIKNIEELKTDFNLFQAECLPRGIKINDIKNLISSEIEKSEAFNKTKFDSTEVQWNEETLNRVKRVYTVIKFYPLILLLIIIALILVIMLFIPGFKKDFSALSFVFFFSGFGIRIINHLGKPLLQERIDLQLEKVPSITSDAHLLIKRIIDLLINELYSKNLVWSAVCFVIAAVLAGTYFYLKTRRVKLINSNTKLK